MATVTEDYVSFELSKLLKEKGFEIDTTKDYWKIGPDGTKYFMCSIGAYTSDIKNKYAYYRHADSYPCPTQAVAMKWLRKVHNINIDIVPVWNQKRFEYQVFIVTPENAKHCYVDEKLYLGYEEAAETGIKYSLENLI